MVRFFTNPYEDYQPGAKVEINTEDIKSKINDITSDIVKRLPPVHSKVDGGLYVGVSGISYMFYRLSKNPVLGENKQYYLEKSMEYLSPALTKSAGDPTSFLLGDAGTYALASVVKKALDDKSYIDYVAKYKKLYNHYLHPKFLKKCGGDEFFVGRAGYIAGVLWMRKELKEDVLSDEELYQLCNVIITSGKNYSQKLQSPMRLSYHYYNLQYLGAAHGVSFIMQMLLSVPGYLSKDQTAAEDVMLTVDFLSKLQCSEGNWPSSYEEFGYSQNELVHWCHGAPGIIYLMAKSSIVMKDQKFYQHCLQAGEVIWEKGLLKKGPGICHGIAGNAYAFLLLFRLTGDHKYIYRANKFTEFMNTDLFLKESNIPDNPESLYEGVAGTACFLADLLVPDKAEFPFQDVF